MDSEYSNIQASDKISWTHLFRQILVASILWISFMHTGFGMGTLTVAIPQLRKQANSTAAVSDEMSSWVSAAMGYSGSLNLVIIVPMGHFLGRKKTMIFLSVSTLVDSAIMYFSNSALHLLFGQILLGLSAAAQCSILLLILSEYSSPKYRGVFLTIKSATFFWGMWIANAMGIFTLYNYIGLVGLFTSSCSLIMSLVIPESPYWLAFKGRYDECAVAHRWLKGANEDSEKELEILIKSQKENEKAPDSVKTFREYLGNCFTCIKQPHVFKPLLICILVTASYHLSGKLVCAVYAIEMMKKFTGNQSTVYIGVLTLDGFTVIGMYIGCGLSKILKRRTLLLVTSVIGTIFLFMMSIYLFLVKLKVFPENDYIIIAMLVGYSLAVCCGPIILATSITAELLPISCRSVCALIYSVLALNLLGTVVKLSPYVFNAIGFHGAYLGFGICMTIITTLMYKYVPETKDQTLHDIANIFKPKENKETQRKLLQNS